MSEQRLMEDRRTAIAIFLCIAIVMVYTQVVFPPQRMAQPPAPTQPAEPSVAGADAASGVAPHTLNTPRDITQAQQASPAKVLPPVTGAVAAQQVRQGSPNRAELDVSSRTLIDTGKAVITINHLGARVEKYLLSEYRRELESPQPLDMVEVAEGAPLPLGLYSGGVNDAFVEYQLAGTTAGVTVVETEEDKRVFALKPDQELGLKFVGTLLDGRTVEKTLQFTHGSYVLRVKVKFSVPAVDGSRMWLEWVSFEAQPEEISQFDFKGFNLLEGDEFDSKVVNEVEQGLHSVSNAKWISFSDMYFVAALMPNIDGQNAKFGRNETSFFSQVAGESGDGEFALYIGPKSYPELQRVGHDLHRNVDLGWFSFLSHPLLQLIRFFYGLLGNYGLAIVLLTLVLKALFLPLTQKSFKSMQAMQDLQPEIKALRERVKDPTQLNQELMGLYKKRGVNPMGGCLPLLIQFPVFIGLYYALLYAIEIRHAPFALWIIDLSAPERLMVAGLPIPVMVLLMGASMFFQQWLTPSAMDPTQKKIMMFMPVVFTFFFLGFPAGLVLYWLVNNLISIVQQIYIRSDTKANPGFATFVASLAIFGFCFVLTLF